MAVKLTRCSEPQCCRQFEYEALWNSFGATSESGLLECPYCGTVTRCNRDFIYFSRPSVRRLVL